MLELDDLIPGTPMTYRERIELAAGDGQGDFEFPASLKNVRGAAEYAAARSAAWLEWNESYARNRQKSDTRTRHLKAQAFSRLYALAVYKSLVGLAAAKLSPLGAERLPEALEKLRELLRKYSECSVCFMAATAKSARHIIAGVKRKNLSLGRALEAEFVGKDEASVKNWAAGFNRKAG